MKMTSTFKSLALAAALLHGSVGLAHADELTSSSGAEADAIAITGGTVINGSKPFPAYPASPVTGQAPSLDKFGPGYESTMALSRGIERKLGIAIDPRFSVVDRSGHEGTIISYQGCDVRTLFPDREKDRKVSIRVHYAMTPPVEMLIPVAVIPVQAALNNANGVDQYALEASAKDFIAGKSEYEGLDVVLISLRQVGSLIDGILSKTGSFGASPTGSYLPSPFHLLLGGSLGGQKASNGVQDKDALAELYVLCVVSPNGKQIDLLGMFLEDLDEQFSVQRKIMDLQIKHGLYNSPAPVIVQPTGAPKG